MAQGKLILVVDDDATMLRLIGRALQSEGYRVATAGDTVQGSLLARRETPDLVIVDMMMPGGGGPRLMETLGLSNRTNMVPLIIITADTSRRPVLEAERYAARLLLKPVPPEEVARAVRDVLGDGPSTVGSSGGVA